MIKVGVLMGGCSLEREVSFNSGRTICDNLDSSIFDILPIFQSDNLNLYVLPWRFLYRGKISDFELRLTSEAEKISWDEIKKRVDIIYPALHGSFAEDGTLQGFLEILNVPYVGSKVYASALCFAKPFHDKFLSMHNVQVPASCLLSIHDERNDLDGFLKNYSFPLIVKPAHEGSSLGVTLVNNQKELEEAIVIARNIDPQKSQDVLVQQKILGMEFSCTAIQDDVGQWEVFEPTEIIHGYDSYIYGYVDKYMPGKGDKITPARCSEEKKRKIQQEVERVLKILDVQTVARVDGFLTPEGEIVILETNTFPGACPSSFIFWQAALAGYTQKDVINKLLIYELKRYGFDINYSEASNQAGKKMKIAVLLGGSSNEREVSLDSGRNIICKLSASCYQVIPLFVSQENKLYHISHELFIKNSTAEIALFLDDARSVQWADLPSLCDFVFLGLHGGVGENGVIQGTLDMLRLPYNGCGLLASAICMDKHKTNFILQKEGFYVPNNVLFMFDKAYGSADVEALLKTKISFPVIIKPHNDGSSVGIFYCRDNEEVSKALQEIRTIGCSAALCEEYINGMELTVGVLGNEEPKALVPTYTPKKAIFLSMEEKFLPGEGENLTPAPLSTQQIELVQRTIERAYKVLGCSGYARVDCFLKKAGTEDEVDKVIILEFNTLPALTPATCLFHQAAEANMKPIDLLNKIIELGFQRQKALQGQA